MTAINQSLFTKDLPSKKIFISRRFEAGLQTVWKAWTESEFLDQWWAPKPWHAHTKLMEFRPGGKWFYFMEGPDGTRHHCLMDYELIMTERSFSGISCFCDENAVINDDMPRMHWDVRFQSSGDATTVEVEITFVKEEDLATTIEMGFQEGFTAAHGNLDELLASKKGN